MSDHAKFQYLSLSPNESEEIHMSSYFQNLFKELNDMVMNKEAFVPQLISKNKDAVNHFIQFKIILLKKLMKCEIELGMAPTFINHMINEAMEYYRVLCIADDTIAYNSVLENIRLHKVWLPDASGHANFIASHLDAVERPYINKALEFEKRFDHLFKKAFEMYKLFERTGLKDKRLNYFNQEVEETLEQFILFLENLQKLRKDCKIYATGLISPLVPNHMMREEKYYIYRVKSL